jgi:LysM repeat protein
MIRMLRAMLFVGAVAGLGLTLRWATAGFLAGASSADFASLVSLLAAAVAWSAYGWLCLAVTATMLERAPGVLGRYAAAFASRVTSGTSRTLLRSALGVAAVAPLTVGVAHAAPAEPAHTIQAHWAPVEPASRVHFATDPTRQLPAPDRPTTERRLAVPDRPTVGAPTRYTPVRHVVRSGDSLWSIAAAELGPDAGDTAIASRWPQWYAANAAAVGADPDLIRPGQTLRAPANHTSTTNEEK